MQPAISSAWMPTHNAGSALSPCHRRGLDLLPAPLQKPGAAAIDLTSPPSSVPPTASASLPAGATPPKRRRMPASWAASKRPADDPTSELPSLVSHNRIAASGLLAAAASQAGGSTQSTQAGQLSRQLATAPQAAVPQLPSIETHAPGQSSRQPIRHASEPCMRCQHHSAHQCGFALHGNLLAGAYPCTVHVHR